MGQSKDRRNFLKQFLPEKKEMVKMLSTDGKLVEVDKRILEAITTKKKATVAEIKNWINPQKLK